MAESESGWIYLVGSERKGPASAHEIALLLSCDRLSLEALVWKSGA